MGMALGGCRRGSAPAEIEEPRAALPIRGFAPGHTTPAAEEATRSGSASGAGSTMPAMPDDAVIEAAVSELLTTLLQLPEKRRTDDGVAPARVAFFPADGSASECRFDDSTCDLRFEGLFIGAGGSGRWRTFRKRDLGRGPLEVADGATFEWIPYEQWRQHERTPAPGTTHELYGPTAQLPSREAGRGTFGYGEPTHQVDGATFRHPTAKVLGSVGIVIKQVDYFGTAQTKPGERGPYPVFTVGWPPGEAVDVAIVVGIASRLVAANGGFPLELVVSPEGARFQVDHLRSKAHDTANVYTLGPLGFEPVGMWLKPKR